MADEHEEIAEKLLSIDRKLDQLGGVFQTALDSAKNALSGEISQVNGNTVTLGNNVTTAVTRELSETKRLLSEGFTEQRNKLSAIPAMQSAITEAITATQGVVSEKVSGVRTLVETTATTTRDGIAALGSSIQTAKAELTAYLDSVKSAVLSKDDEIIAKCVEISTGVEEVHTVVDKIDESTRSLFVAYSNMVGEISRLATEAAQNFAKDLLIANELRDAVANCEEIIDIFNDLKGTYENIASIAAEGLKLFTKEGPFRKTLGQIEAAKDVSFALSSLTNVFRAFKQESRESRFDF